MLEKFLLNNGIRVVTKHIPNVRSVAFAVWVKTGSRYEKRSENGISHLIEHMLFKGTAKYDVRAIAQQFDRIGGHVNAFTAKEYTCYYFKVLDEHLPIALDVLSDMLYHPLMDEAELEKEKNVIYEEIAMVEDTPDDIVHDLVAEASYGSHPLAYPILGLESNLQQMTPQILFDYMKDHYHADNIVISAAGKIDDVSIEQIRKAFDRPIAKGQPVAIEPPGFIGKTLYQHKQTEQQHICLAVPGVSIGSSELYVMSLINNLIGGGMSSRLFQEIREKRGLAYSIYSYHSAFEDAGQFVIYTGTAPKYSSEVLNVIIDTIGEFLTKGIDDNELEQGKEQLKGSFVLSMESTSSHSNRLGKFELMIQRHETLDETIRKIESIKREDVMKLARKLFSEPFATAVLGETDEMLNSFRSDQLALFNQD